MVLHPDGTAEVIEREGRARTLASRWYVELDNTVVVDGANLVCARRGRVEGSTLNMTCTWGTRTWALMFDRQ